MASSKSLYLQSSAMVNHGTSHPPPPYTGQDSVPRDRERSRPIGPTPKHRYHDDGTRGSLGRALPTPHSPYSPCSRFHAPIFPQQGATGRPLLSGPDARDVARGGAPAGVPRRLAEARGRAPGGDAAAAAAGLPLEERVHGAAHLDPEQNHRDDLELETEGGAARRSSVDPAPPPPPPPSPRLPPPPSPPSPPPPAVGERLDVGRLVDVVADGARGALLHVVDDGDDDGAGADGREGAPAGGARRPTRPEQLLHVPRRRRREGGARVRRAVHGRRDRGAGARLLPAHADQPLGHRQGAPADADVAPPLPHQVRLHSAAEVGLQARRLRGRRGDHRREPGVPERLVDTGAQHEGRQAAAAAGQTRELRGEVEPVQRRRAVPHVHLPSALLPQRMHGREAAQPVQPRAVRRAPVPRRQQVQGEQRHTAAQRAARELRRPRLDHTQQALVGLLQGARQVQLLSSRPRAPMRPAGTVGRPTAAL